MLLLVFFFKLFVLVLFQRNMSLCAPIQDNQVIFVHMPLSISPLVP